MVQLSTPGVTPNRGGAFCQITLTSCFCLNYPLMVTLKPQSNGPLYNNTVIGTLAFLGCTGCGSAQSPHRCTKCKSPSINGQLTNFTLFDPALVITFAL